MSAAVLRSVPTTYGAVYTEYFPYIIKLVRKAGIDHQNVEDVAMSLLTKFYEKDVLADFNPDHVTNHDGKIRKAEFSTFLSGFVFSYVRYIKGRETLEAAREVTLMDAPARLKSDENEELTWGVLNSGVYEDFYEELEMIDLISTIHKTLSVAEIKSAKNQCDLPLFFDLIHMQVTEYGQLDIIELSELFGVSKTSIQNWLKRLREQVTAALAA